MKNETVLRRLGTVFLCLACLVLGAALTMLWETTAQQIPAAPPISAQPPAVAGGDVSQPETPDTSGPAQPEEPTDDPAILDNGLPKDQMYTTPARRGYTDGQLRLVIPKLGVDIPVLNGVDSKTLLRGVGLYDYAQLPGEGGANTSIAGHRNGLRHGKITDSMPFYYINTLTEGDYLYLRDGNTVYQYLWECTQVIQPDDWGPIYNQGYACLTLTSCTPIGVADHRLVVRGALVKTLSPDKDGAYPSNVTEEAAP